MSNGPKDRRYVAFDLTPKAAPNRVKLDAWDGTCTQPRSEIDDTPCGKDANHMVWIGNDVDSAYPCCADHTEKLRRGAAAVNVTVTVRRLEIRHSSEKG